MNIANKTTSIVVYDLNNNNNYLSNIKKDSFFLFIACHTHTHLLRNNFNIFKNKFTINSLN